MRATWSPLPVWPYPPRPSQVDRFDSTWDATLDKLELEISRVDGDDVVIGVVASADAISMSGALRYRSKVTYPGAEVSFFKGAGRVTFHTDAYGSLQSNLRAIALGLEALRAVDRYGITSSGEQYAGFAALGPGGPDPLRGKRLVDEYGSIAEALKKTHPDQGGSAAAFADVQAYRQSIGAAAR
jgi:hypothetical protein